GLELGKSEASRDIASINHEVGEPDYPGIIKHGVVGDNYRAVRALKRRVIEPNAGKRLSSVNACLGYERVVIADIGASIKELFNNAEGRRFANVVDVPLVSHAQHEDSRALYRLALVVQSVLDQLNDMPGHMGIHFLSQADETGLESVEPRLP